MRRLARFLTRKDGAIAVEFAFVAPIMLGMFFGLTELALALGAKADVINLTSVGADLVAQKSSVSTSDMSNVFSALSAMLYPYSTAPAQITITSVVDNNTSTSGKVAWSCTQGGTARTVNATYTFPTTAQGVITSGSGSSVIMAEVTYTYTLPVSISLPGILSLTGPYTMTNTFFSKPRRVSQIPLTSCP
jgi:Flp pilus assembly protein TadG